MDHNFPKPTPQTCLSVSLSSETLSFPEDTLCRLLSGSGEKFLPLLADLFSVDLWSVALVTGESFGTSSTSELSDCLLARVDLLVPLCGVLRLLTDFTGELRPGVAFLTMDCKHRLRKHNEVIRSISIIVMTSLHISFDLQYM